MISSLQSLGKAKQVYVAERKLNSETFHGSVISVLHSHNCYCLQTCTGREKRSVIRCESTASSVGQGAQEPLLCMLDGDNVRGRTCAIILQVIFFTAKSCKDKACVDCGAG